uniref:uncharacterized protein LOC124036148 isoform X2 n=1 Tax=Oncorhynchus gorbuscha TaxID=8017 RepID=UPI001EAF3C97|nr:uncharacterized protein LOC124036148 isoform X2 [Oncorhynchus gorbuscha]
MYARRVCVYVCVLYGVYARRVCVLYGVYARRVCVYVCVLCCRVLEATLGLREQKESLVHRVLLALLAFLQLKGTEVLQESPDKMAVLGHLVISLSLFSRASQGKLACRIPKGQWACMATQEPWV